MQPYFHWINEPAEWRRDSDGLTVVTNKHTDFWRHTWYGFERFSGHLYAAEVAGDFTLQAKICADFTTLYDQAGLMMMADEQTWLKAELSLMTMPGHRQRTDANPLRLGHRAFPRRPAHLLAAADPQGRRVKAAVFNRRRALAAAAARLLSARPGESGRHVLLTGAWRTGGCVSGYSAFPAAGQSAARSELNASGKTRLSLHPGPRIAGFAGAREIKMTVLIGIGAARAPCPTRGIIDIAAVRTVAAVGASAHRLPLWPP